MDASPPPALSEMSEESAGKKVDEDVKESFTVRNIHEEAYFTDLPPVGREVEAKEAYAELLAQFAHACSQDPCLPEGFEEAFSQGI